MPRTWPVPGDRITQTFSPSHKAVDVGVPTGTPVVAPVSGKVVKAGWDTSGYGNLVVVQSGEEKHYLAHLSGLAVKPGDTVKAGQQVGLSGSTGRSTGPHLHYEVRVGSSGWLDPLKQLYEEITKGVQAVRGRATTVVSQGVMTGIKTATPPLYAPAVQALGQAGSAALQSTTKPEEEKAGFAGLIQWPTIDWGRVAVGVVGVVFIIGGVVKMAAPSVTPETVGRAARAAITKSIV